MNDFSEAVTKPKSQPKPVPCRSAHLYVGSCLYCQTSKLLNDNKTKSRVKLRNRFAARLFYILECMAYKSKEFLNNDKISRLSAWRDVWHCDRCDEKTLDMKCDATTILEHAAYVLGKFPYHPLKLGNKYFFLFLNMVWIIQKCKENFWEKLRK